MIALAIVLSSTLAANPGALVSPTTVPAPSSEITGDAARPASLDRIIALGSALPDPPSHQVRDDADKAAQAARPNPLLNAAPASPSSNALFPFWLAVGGLAVIAAAVTLRNKPRERTLRVVEAVQIGRGQRLAIVAVGESHILVSATDKGVSVIRDRIDVPAPRNPGVRVTLSSLLGQRRPKLEEPTFDDLLDDAASSEEDDLRNQIRARRREKGSLSLVGGME